MRRLLTILLLLVLPLQFSWAAAAAYCQHGGASDRQAHMGHHEHRHVADSAPDADPQAHAGMADAGQQQGVDDDCAFCHFGCGKTVGTTPVQFAAVGRPAFAPDVAAPPASPRPSRIERPNWRAG